MDNRQKVLALEELLLDEIMGQSDDQALSALTLAEHARADELIAATRAAYGRLRMARARAALEADQGRARTAPRPVASSAPLMTKAARSGSADDTADQASFDEDMAELEADEEHDEE